MEIIVTNSGAEAQRMFGMSTSQGEAYINDVGAQQYLQQLQSTANVTQDMITHSTNHFNTTAVEHELVNELWSMPQVNVASAVFNDIHAIDNKEALQSATPVMMNYLFSEPVIMDAYNTGKISGWTDFTPAASTTIWETVNTGTCTLEGNKMTITEYINRETKLTVEQRIAVLDAQQFVIDSLEDEDPWSDTIIYY